MPGLEDQLGTTGETPVEQEATSTNEAIPGVSKLHATLGKRTQERDEAIRERDALREQLATIHGQVELAREPEPAPQQQETAPEYEEGATYEVVNGQLVKVDPPQPRGQNGAREYRHRETFDPAEALASVFNG